MAYIWRKLGFYAIALWVAVTLNFLIPRLARGNPVDIVMARFQSRTPPPPQFRHSLEIMFGVSKDPLWIQYLEYLRNLLTGNLGTSVTFYPVPVTEVIGQSMPWTLALMIFSLLLTVAIGLTLGMLAGWRRGSWLDGLIPSATFVQSIPYFWLALLLLYVGGVGLGWFPVNGAYDYANVQLGFTPAFLLSTLHHGFLPALTIILSGVAGWMLGMRNMMISVMAEDYVATAEAKGLKPRRVMVSYAGRNAVLPSVAGFAITLGFLVGGQVGTEIVFSYPGVGYALLQAVQSVDYPLMQGIFLMISLAVLGANLVADLVYGLIDPRTRTAS